MSKATRATRALDAAGVAYRLHPYDYKAEAGAKGLQAAQALGLPPARVLKSLMVWVDSRAVCVVVPSDRRVQLKKLAAAAAGKSARMMEVAEAERRSGYKVGGISPLGQQRPVPVLIEQSALAPGSLWFNAGQRGLLLEIDAERVLEVLQARACDLCE
ncbi:Cys-tRNA(Pro) deacylase [Xanthomonas hyacinthi]|uniref:Cys-tRNA(Pro)/Cys-tRNA(Cys) deacylase n=1 Tax=Xanthomonas hyacinthi TaxID=56455 RepID=A0A2S7F2Q7_9XANT|nr:Cys-tRNA(Pro) deacylase [Xanthomonas hyacinthi]KLD77029.1 prolyl-tRNA synthetase [Xanthomonas hyacinthi DSM 19077]PPU99732.1 Cys-tRNA(Pro) deacylase [Xanthomonas hyacinthi]QGY75882.1 Cys-tRNA(Pro) deacylase [Xanthomonas hyacinthi]